MEDQPRISVHSKGNGLAYFSVSASPYSAVGDGTSDCTAAITAAVEDANAANGVVFFPIGVYEVGTPMMAGISGGTPVSSIEPSPTNDDGDVKSNPHEAEQS